MKRLLIYDLPTRLFHFLFAVGVLAAAAIGLFGEDSESLFVYHQIIGLILALLLVLRLVWGFMGTRHARFVSFMFRPSALVGYFKGVLAGGGRKYAGHNPASGYAAFAMIVLAMMIIFSGLMMIFGSEVFEELHGLLVYVMLGVIALHIAGVTLHSLQYKDSIWLSMINGTKSIEGDEAITSTKPLAAGVMLLLLVLWAGGLLLGFDNQTQRLTLPGTNFSLQLGEEHGHEHHDDHAERRDHDDDD